MGFAALNPPMRYDTLCAAAQKKPAGRFNRPAVMS